VRSGRAARRQSETRQGSSLYRAKIYPRGIQRNENEPAESLGAAFGGQCRTAPGLFYMGRILTLTLVY